MRISQQSIVQQNKRNRALAFVAIILLEVVSAILNTIYHSDAKFLLFSVVITTICYVWLLLEYCRFDSRTRRYRFKFRDGIWIVMFAIIGVPLYFWRSRSRSEFFKHVGGLYLVTMPTVIQYVTSWALIAVLQAVGYYS